nr:DUF896 domain-containing protein [uncultured Acetobacterium sp.]
MITKEKIERINELARKKKIETLSEDELDEQMTLRAEYLAAIRKNCREQLDSIIIVDEPQCDNKGGNKMKNDEKNGSYGEAEALGNKEKGEAGGADSIYSNAEELGKKNATDPHEFMAGEEDEKARDKE